MAKAPVNTAAQLVHKKVRKNVSDGVAHVHASFSNTIITITDRQGNHIVLRLPRVVRVLRVTKFTPFAAQVASEVAGRAAQSSEIKTWTSDQRPGRAAGSSIRALAAALGIRINSIADVAIRRLSSSKRRRIWLQFGTLQEPCWLLRCAVIQLQLR